MTHNEAVEQIRKLSTELMHLSNRIGNDNSAAYAAVVEADCALFRFLKNEEQNC